VYRHDAPPVLVRGVGKQFLLGDTGIANQYLQSAQFLLCTAHSGGNLCDIGSVCLQCQEPATAGALLRLFQYLLACLAVIVPGERHIITGGSEGQYRRRADTTAAAGDQYTLFHLISSFASRAAS